MASSRVAGEEAVNSEEGEDFDTQRCLDLQKQILSSSPPRGDQVASSFRDPTHSHAHLATEWIPEEVRVSSEFIAYDAPSLIDPQFRTHPSDPRLESSGASNGGRSTFPQILKATITHQRVERYRNEKVRPSDVEGGLSSVSPEFEHSHELKPVKQEMEDLTPKSSLGPMSPTQENSDSAYAQFDLQKPLLDQYMIDGSSNVEQAVPAPGQDSLTRQHHSAFTDSTAHTYRENDTGHVNFDSIMPDDDLDEPISQSQDASFAAPKHPFYEPQSYEPQTPAAPINPFTYKGSVMKGHEMFGATQPSSIGRQIASAASTRPSPDVYNDYTPPAKRFQSSPLPGRLIDDETTPLQSSVRNLLRSRSEDSPQKITHPRTSGVRSFDSAPKFLAQSTSHDPRPYVSMKESQERRRMTASSPSGPDTDSEDDVPRQRLRKQKREQEIQKQMSGVILHSRPSSSGRAFSSPGIEVPSTGRRGRRRSTQDEYNAQCEGVDARDTQQEDVIADSQAVAADNETGDITTTEALHHTPSLLEYAASDKSNIAASHEQPSYGKTADQEQTQDLDPNEVDGDPSSPPKDPDSPPQQPSLPLQIVSINRNGTRTPTASKTKMYSDAADTTVPETSPSDDRIQPMGEIASLSFGDSQYEPIDAPGFSQVDTGFEDMIRPQSSPNPSPRKSKVPRVPPFPSSGPSNTAEETPGKSNEFATSPDFHTAVEEVEEPQVEEPQVITTVIESPSEPFPPSASIKPSSNLSEHNEEAVSEDVPSLDDIIMNSDVNGVEQHTEADADEEPDLRSSELVGRRSGLRTKSELRGPTKNLRRQTNSKPLKTYVTPRQSGRITKSSSTSRPTSHSSKQTTAEKIMSTPMSSLTTMASSSAKTTPTKSSTRKPASKATIAKDQTPVPARENSRSTRRSLPTAKHNDLPTPVSNLTKSSSRKVSTPATAPVEATAPSTRSSKRQSISKPRRDSRLSSADPLAGPTPAIDGGEDVQNATALFVNMSFAVSYVKQQEEKDKVTRLIKEGGGQILLDGFDSLFDLKPRTIDTDNDLTLSPAATRVGFAALIADEHSRRAKYMQALALGLPCISGRWISVCVSKGELVSWTPYLLCAGQSSFLGNAVRSRTLLPYLAADANFSDIFANRDKLLAGKSVLLVTGKGRGAEEKRKAYVFLARALGPTRFEQVQDFEQARKKLLDSEGQNEKWDLLYVDNNEAAAESIVFGSTPTSSGGSKKRKRGPVAAEEGTPAPKKIRIISDEVVIQSLILGELLE